MRQFDAGDVELHFDEATETCNIVPREKNPPAGDQGTVTEQKPAP
jgi:hypothetical protein